MHIVHVKFMGGDIPPANLPFQIYMYAVGGRTMQNGNSHFIKVILWLLGSSSPGMSPCQGHYNCNCVVFLGKTLYSHCVSLHPGV